MPRWPAAWRRQKSTRSPTIRTTARRGRRARTTSSKRGSWRRSGARPPTCGSWAFCEGTGMDQNLKGKIAFVSGSGRGLGSVMATRLAERGAHVAVHDLSWDATAKYGESENLGVMQKKIEALGVHSTAVTGNIGDQNAVREMHKKIEADLGPVDILVNCAGGDI